MKSVVVTGNILHQNGLLYTHKIKFKVYFVLFAVIMRTLQDLRDISDIKWEQMSRYLVFKLFYKHPNRDFIISPVNILENGEVREVYPMDASFDCPLFPTPFKRNLFRLYATIARVVSGVQLGIPDDHLGKMKALEIGHPYFINEYFQLGSEAARALKDIYTIMFADTIVEPVSDASDAIEII